MWESVLLPYRCVPEPGDRERRPCLFTPILPFTSSGDVRKTCSVPRPPAGEPGLVSMAAAGSGKQARGAPLKRQWGEREANNQGLPEKSPFHPCITCWGLLAALQLDTYGLNLTAPRGTAGEERLEMKM
ncbi:UNVERIFIED_CONTAM: hypothetical protein FKN15_009202 [Acipenser sinensis]